MQSLSVRRSRRKSAFTLIELLVVVAIIAVLIAILMPSLARARRQAQNLQCLTTLRSLQSANEIYANQFNDYFVPLIVAAPGISLSGGWPYERWDGNREFRSILRLDDSVSASSNTLVPRSMICPLAAYALENRSAVPTAGKGYDFLMYRSYSYNIEQVQSTAWTSNFVTYKRTQVIAPANRFIFSDGMNFYTTAWQATQYSGESATSSGAATRHDGHANVAFLDGHAEPVKGAAINYMYTGANQYNKVIPMWRVTAE